MANKAYGSKTTLIGGGATALDSIDGAGLVDGDIAFVAVSGILYVYRLNSTSGATDDGLNVIAPDANAGDKRWILQYHEALSKDKIAKAWVKFNGTGTVAIVDDFNVDSITDDGTGDYTITFTTALDSANYVAAGMAGHTSNGGYIRLRNGETPAAGSCKISTMVNDGQAAMDTIHCMVAFFGG